MPSRLQAWKKHARFYSQLSTTYCPRLNTKEAPQILPIVDEEIANIRLAIAHARMLERHEFLVILRDFCLVLFSYFDKRGLWKEWIDLAQQGLRACQTLTDPYSLSVAFPIISNNLGIAYRTIGQRELAKQAYEWALAKSNHEALRADALTNLSDIYRFQGDTRNAMEHAQQAVTIGQRLGDKGREAKALEYLGLTYHVALRDHDAAIQCFQQALALRDMTDNLPRKAFVVCILMDARIERGADDDFEQAFQHYTTGMNIANQLRDDQIVKNLKVSLATLHQKRREYTEAIVYWNEVVDLCNELGICATVASGHFCLTEIFLDLNDMDKARSHADQGCLLLEHIPVVYLSYYRIGSILIALARKITHNKLYSLQYAETAMQIATLCNNQDEIKAASAIIAKSHA